MSTFLPQQDPDLDDRRKELEKCRREYEYNYTHISPLAMADRVPRQDEPSIKWILLLIDRAFDLLANLIEIEKDRKTLDHHRKRHAEFKELARLGTPNIKNLIAHLQDSIERVVATERPDDFDYYADIFRKIQLPAVAKNYWQDEVFARMRVAGPNPIVIARVDALDDRFPVTEEIYRSVMGDDDSLDAAGREGRLYLADYRVLDFVVDGSFPLPQKYVYSPLSLYAVDKDSRQLRPVAIQCRQTPAPDNPIFTPHDGDSWLIAKTVVEIADGNYHEAISHLAQTHLFVDPFVVATRRNLASNHPLNLLLVPHFEGTLYINNLAQEYLISAGHGVDRLLCGTIDSDRLAAVKGVRGKLFDGAMLPESFKARGVDDPELLPDYPFRDDSLAYWNAIRDWVESYLGLYYTSDADVAADPELAAWVRELGAHDGGRVPGMSGEIGTLGYLTDAVTLIIYTASVQHAAVNFPQYDLMSYCPNMPLAAYAPAPTDKNATRQDYLDMLPTKSGALYQQAILYFLGSVHYTTLGKYPRRHFRDRRVEAPLEAFNRRLQTVGDTIKLKNRESREPYTTLLPKGIPQSINI